MGNKHAGQIERNREYIRRHKELHPCSCGEGRTICLDFHHKDPSDKLFGINSAGHIGLERLKAEIEKCIVICANCHRVLHELEREENAET